MYKPKLPANVKPLNWIGPDDPNYIEAGLIHCTHVPQEASRARPVPVVVMIHGWGGDESAMWIFKQTLPKGVAAITPRAPIELDEGGFIWFLHEKSRLQPAPDSFELGLNKLEHFLNRLPHLYPVDPYRLVLMGFSQGAGMSNAFIATHPNAAIGVASLAGGLFQIPDVEEHPQLLAGLPIFIAHGSQDEIVPIERARQTREWYTQLGAEVTYNEYPTAHKMNPDGIKDLKAWLAKLFPRTS